MGDRKVYKNRNAISTAGDGGSSPAAAERGPGSVPGISSVQEATARYEAEIEPLRVFAQRTDGWLRVVPQEDGNVVYYKWKYTTGKCHGRYCMWIDIDRDPLRALSNLLQKIELCDVGVHQCVQDKFYQ